MDAMISSQLLPAAQFAQPQQTASQETVGTQFKAVSKARDLAAQGQMSPSKAKKVATDFESVFLATMLAPVFEGSSLENSMSGSHAEKTYKGLLVEQYAEGISKAGGIGVADYIYREMMSLQEFQR